MKKTLFTFSLLILILGLTSCGGQIPVEIPANANGTNADSADSAKTGAEDQPDEAPAVIATPPAEGSNEPNELSNADVNKPTEGTVNTGTDARENDQTIVQPQTIKNIIVEKPLPNSTITSPFEIIGQARVFEGTVLVRVKNQNGATVIPAQIAAAHAKNADEFGAFKITLSYQFYNTKEGVIEVFSQSAADGSEINMVVIPVKFE